LNKSCFKTWKYGLKVGKWTGNWKIHGSSRPGYCFKIIISFSFTFCVFLSYLNEYTYIYLFYKEKYFSICCRVDLNHWPSGWVDVFRTQTSKCCSRYYSWVWKLLEYQSQNATKVLIHDVWGQARFQPSTVLFCIRLSLDTV
jgi:hypothetical protein